METSLQIGGGGTVLEKLIKVFASLVLTGPVAFAVYLILIIAFPGNSEVQDFASWIFIVGVVIATIFGVAALTLWALWKLWGSQG